MVYDIDSIKQRNPIRDVVTGHGVALRESGTHLVCPCPSHEAEHPSFAVYPDTRRFYCSGCNVGGDIIDFVRYRDFSEFDLKLDLLD
jgi:DNA primase